MKIKSCFQISKKEPCLISSSSKDALASEIRRCYYFLISASYVASTHCMLPYFTKSAHFCVAHTQTHKLTNKCMDRQSDYSTSCAQAHWVTKRERSMATYLCVAWAAMAMMNMEKDLGYFKKFTTEAKIENWKVRLSRGCWTTSMEASY